MSNNYTIFYQNNDTNMSSLFIATNGNYIYVASSTNGTISKLNLADGSVVKANWCTGFNPFLLLIAGDYMYSINGNSICKIKLSDGSIVNQKWVTGLDIPNGMAVNGNYMYVSSYNNYISQLDLSTGYIINQRWCYSNLSRPAGMIINGQYLYIANTGNDTISKINLSDGSNTTPRWVYNLSGPISLAISGAYMYVTNFHSASISQIHLSNGYITNLSWAINLFAPYDLTINGTNLYVTAFQNTGLNSRNYITAFTLPDSIADPGLANSSTTITQGTNKYRTFVNPVFNSIIYSLATDGTYLYSMYRNYIASTTSISKIDISNGSVVDAIWCTSLNYGYDMVIHENYMYVSNNIQSGTISKVNLSDGKVINGTWASGLNFPNRMTISGSYLYVTNNTNSICKINLSDGSIVNLNWAIGLNYPSAMVVKDSSMYITNLNGNSISKINLSDGSVVNFVSGLIGPNSISVYGNYLYVTNNANSIVQILLSNGTISDLNWATDLNYPSSIVINGNNMYLANNTDIILFNLPQLEGNKNTTPVALKPTIANPATANASVEGDDSQSQSTSSLPSLEVIISVSVIGVVILAVGAIIIYYKHRKNSVKSA